LTEAQGFKTNPTPETDDANNFKKDAANFCKDKNGKR